MLLFLGWLCEEKNSCSLVLIHKRYKKFADMAKLDLELYLGLGCLFLPCRDGLFPGRYGLLKSSDTLCTDCCSGVLEFAVDFGDLLLLIALGICQEKGLCFLESALTFDCLGLDGPSTVC